jgi:hypothetical protein
MQTMTTWKQRKKVAKRQKLFRIGLAAVPFFLGVLVGLWWNDTQSTVQQLTYDLMRAQFDLAQAKVELDKASKISNIRHNIEAVLLKILDVNSKQSKRVEVAEKNMNKNTREKAKRELELRWASALSPLQDQLTQLEQTLSELENREPRNFDLLSMTK